MATLGIVSLVGISVVCLSLIASTQGNDSCNKDARLCSFDLQISHVLSMWAYGWLPPTPENRGFRQVYFKNGTLYSVLEEFDPPLTVSLDSGVITADGFEEPRLITVANNQLPGPSIDVYVGQEVTVNVKNDLLTEAVSIHWHGITVRDTPWMDGAGFITQCPILPGQNFTYKFTVDQKGTYFWHAHLGKQIGDGLVGAFIVRDPTDFPLEEQEHVVMIQDWNHQTSTLNMIQSRFVRYHDGSRSTRSRELSALINGRGRGRDGNDNVYENVLTVFPVEQGQDYRFRIINAGSSFAFEVFIDGHRLEVVAMDGQDIEPIIVDSVVLLAGERFDVIIRTDQLVDNYWLKAIVPEFAGDSNIVAESIVRYTGSPDAEPISRSRSCSVESPCILLNCLSNKIKTANITCVSVDSLRSLHPIANPPLVPDHELILNNAGMFRPSGVIEFIGGVVNILPTVSALTQPDELDTLCDERHNCSALEVCFCTHRIDIELGDVVQLTMSSLRHGSAHPMHLHGFHFQVLKIGYREVDEKFKTTSFSPDLQCPVDPSSGEAVCHHPFWTNSSWTGGNIPGLPNIERAPLKDTVGVPSDGYVVVRFRADNPGLWLYHCHIARHEMMGMSLMFNVSAQKARQAPRNFPKCSSFRSETTEIDGANGEENSQPSTNTPQPCRDNTAINDDYSAASVETAIRCYVEAEFWGMFGSFLFLVLLQFLILACILTRRTNASYSTK